MVDPVIYHIYTQPDCIFCLKTKELLDHMNLTYEEHDITTNESARRFFKLRQFTKVPQIFENGRHIGGFTQLDAHLTGKIVSG